MDRNRRHETTVRPVSLRVEDAGVLHPAVLRAIKIAAEVKAGKRLDQHLFDGVALALKPAEDLRMKRRLLRKGRKARGDQDLVAEKCLALFPCL